MPLNRFERLLRPGSPPTDDVVVAQYGAIPYQIVDDRAVFLLVTSRRSANWVFPKGSQIKGLSGPETAAREAFEEAGVRGEIETDPIGSYFHPRNKQPEELCEILLYPLLVTEQLDAWPEEPQRFRHWVLLPEAQRLLASREAARVAVELNRRILFGDQAGSSPRKTK